MKGCAGIAIVSTKRRGGGNMPHRAIRPYAIVFIDTAHDATLATSQHHKSANA
jgi:hypothetical protein